MPPKAGITKDMIFNAAFELVREQGLEVLTARSIAQKLNCSTQPIYSMYENMEKVKEDVFSHAVDFALRCMEQYEDERNEPAMNLAVGCLLFARDERQLFKTLFLSDYSSGYFKSHKDKFHEQLYAAFLKLDNRISSIETEKVQKIFLKLTAYWLGIATMIHLNMLEIDISEAIEMLAEMYGALTLN